MVATLARARHIRSVVRELDARLTRGPNGIVVGAEPIELDADGPAAVLLIHGGADTPQTLRYVADALHAKGFAVRAPLLPGHGRSISDFERVSADDWTNAAFAEYDGLRARFRDVSIVGLSMGGALATQIAATRSDVSALVLIAPYLTMPRKAAMMAATGALWGPFVKYLRVAERRSILDGEERKRNRGYATFTAPALHALRETVRRARGALSRITAPTLVIQSSNDPRITVDACRNAFALIGATTKELVITDQGGHIVTVDYGRDRVIQLTAEWMVRFARVAGQVV